MHEEAIKEQERIIALLEKDAGECILERPMSQHPSDWCHCRLIALIKDETKKITSELLPDGTIRIEEIKGETNA